MSDSDDLYTVSKHVPKAADPVVKKRRVEDDFFAFHDTDSVVKKKKKKKKVKKRDTAVGVAGERATEEVNRVEHSAKPIPEVREARAEVSVASSNRDVTPPPSSVTPPVSHHKTRQFADDLSDLDIPELDEEFGETVSVSSARRRLRAKPGYRDKFQLKVNLGPVGVDSTLWLEVSGATSCEKIVSEVSGHQNLDEITERVLVFAGVKLHRASPICNVLLVDPQLQKSAENHYVVEMEMVNVADYETQKRGSVSAEENEDADDEEVKIIDDDRFSDLKLADLERLASKSLRSNSELDKPADPTAFSISLRSDERSVVKVTVNPEMKVSEIKAFAQKQFQIADCDLIFDDEHMELQDSVKDTELEEDYIIDVVTK